MAAKKKSKNKISQELGDLAKVLSGEMKLKLKKEELEKSKKKAVERQKDLRRKKVVKGEAVIEKEDPEERKVVQNIKLFEWEAPIRFALPFDPRMFLFLVAGCLIFIVFLAVLGHYGLMFAILALLFFIYAAGTTEPIDVTHKITTRGIDSLDKLYEWYMLEDFWFTNKDGRDVLVVTTRLRAPARLLLLLGKKDRAATFVLLQDKLMYREIKKQSRLDKMTYGEYIPLEKI